MLTSRAKTRDPLVPTNGVRDSSLKRKRESEDNSTALSHRRTSKKPSLEASLEAAVPLRGEVTPSKSTSKKRSSKDAPATSDIRGRPKILVKTTKAAVLDIADDEAGPTQSASKGGVSKRRKKIATVTEEAEQEHDSDCGSVKDDESSPKKHKRKTKEEKEAEYMPLAARSTGLRMFVGAHCSIAKGLENAVKNCVHIGGNAFALFLKSQRKWQNPPLKEDNRDAFKKACVEEKYDAESRVLPHGSYLVNLAQEDDDKAKQAYDGFVVGTPKSMFLIFPHERPFLTPKHVSFLGYLRRDRCLSAHVGTSPIGWTLTCALSRLCEICS